ncbi:MAG: hypothetical protein JNJ63_00975 [Hyphomonadaceae bacterium]|nr:hypothetical protein [Hyphomonadaceae bacterium]
MRRTAIALLLALAACERSEPPPLPPAPQQVAEPPWFICDGIDAPALYVFEREGDVVRVAKYDKPNGAIVERSEYQAAAEEGAAGSVYTGLMQNGAEAGAARQINPGMLETPGAAYTPPFSSIRLGEEQITCRWLPRTRLIGFTGRRSFVVHEDGSGDLIYTTYDFAAAAQQPPIELSENGRTTPFSVEARGGEERLTPNGAEYTFDNRGYRYVVTVSRDGTGALTVLQNGAEVQSEPLIAFQQGSAAE